MYPCPVLLASCLDEVLGRRGPHVGEGVGELLLCMPDWVAVKEEDIDLNFRLNCFRGPWVLEGVVDLASVDTLDVRCRGCCLRRLQAFVG